jgi:hypothetical protein
MIRQIQALGRTAPILPLCRVTVATREIPLWIAEASTMTPVIAPRSLQFVNHLASGAEKVASIKLFGYTFAGTFTARTFSFHRVSFRQYELI